MKVITMPSTQLLEGLRILAPFRPRRSEEAGKYVCDKEVPIHIRYKLPPLGWLVKADRKTFIFPEPEEEN